MNQNMYSREASLNKRQAERATARRRRTGGVAALALAGMLAVGGTMAFLASSTSEVTNTFVPGTTGTDIIEEFDGETKLNVTIVNPSNSTNVPVYIRAKVVVTWAKVDDSGNVVAIHPQAPVLGVDYSNWNSANGWYKYDDCYYWTSPVDPGESTGALIDKIEIKDTANVPDGYVLNVEILSEAIQASGTTSDGTPAYTDAWGVVIKDGTVVAASVVAA